MLLILKSLILESHVNILIILPNTQMKQETWSFIKYNGIYFASA